MKTAWLLGTALLLSACAAPQQAYYAPPAPRTTPAHVQPRVSTPAAPRPIAQQPVRVPQTVPSAGPLRTAMIGGYMDNQERDFREHLRGLGVGVARPGDELVLRLPDAMLFEAKGDRLTAAGRNTLATIAVIARHYDHTAITVT